MRELSEEEKKEICECECGYYPLRHLERCPKCNSESYHFQRIVKKVGEEE